MVAVRRICFGERWRGIRKRAPAIICYPLGSLLDESLTASHNADALPVMVPSVKISVRENASLDCSIALQSIEIKSTIMPNNFSYETYFF